MQFMGVQSSPSIRPKVFSFSTSQITIRRGESMNRKTLIFLLVLALAVALSAKDKKAKGSTEDQIKQLEMDRAAAVVKGDTSMVDKHTADNASFINAQGKMMSKSETVDAIKNGQIKLTSNDLSDINVRMYGNTAVVTGHGHPKGTVMGNAVDNDVLYTRVYVKEKGECKSVAFQQTMVK